MNILVTFAVDPEFAPWPKLHRFTDLSAGDYTLRRTQIAGAIVDFLVTGMGPVHAARALATIDFANYFACIASGLAGAVVPKLEVGTIVTAARIRDGKTNAFLSAHSALLSTAINSGARALDGLASVDSVVTTIEEKCALTPYGEAIDMESFTVVAMAQSHKVPAISIRAISDTLKETIPVNLASAIDEHGQVSIGKVLKMVAGEPGQIADLMRLGRNSKLAADALRQFLARYLAVLGG